MEEGSKNKRKIRKWREECWARTYSLFKDFNLQRLQRNQEESTEEEEVKQQQRMMIMKDLTKKIRTEEKWTLKTCGGFLNCWRQTLAERGFTQDGKILCRNGVIGWRR